MVSTSHSNTVGGGTTPLSTPSDQGNFKVAVNPTLSVDQYSLPEVKDLLATLADGKTFT